MWERFNCFSWWKWQIVKKKKIIITKAKKTWWICCNTQSRVQVSGLQGSQQKFKWAVLESKVDKAINFINHTYSQAFRGGQDTKRKKKKSKAIWKMTNWVKSQWFPCQKSNFKMTPIVPAGLQTSQSIRGNQCWKLYLIRFTPQVQVREEFWDDRSTTEQDCNARILYEKLKED